MAQRLTVALADRYRIGRQLGQGGMALVYLAEDLKHDRQVAIKVLRPELAASVGHERFLREIKIAANLNHPHILPLHDSGEADGFLYYVMPFVEGESLAARIERDGELPLAEAVGILREVTDALKYAHDHNVVHRDIKPDNIMFTGDHVVVTDFGIAKAVSEATGHQGVTSAGIALGTPLYMAPEQAAADPNVDHRADIYATGVVAYEMLTGKPPFDGTTMQEILARHMTQAPDKVSDVRSEVPEALSQFVARSLEKRPEDRFQTAGEAHQSLGAITASFHQSGEAEPTPPTRWWVPGHLITTSVLLLFVVVFGVFLRNSGSTVNDSAGAIDRSVAVLPFSIQGSDIEDWGEGMVHTLSPTIDGAPGLLAISGRTVLARWQEDVPTGEANLDAALGVARNVRASYALIGSSVAAGTDVRIDFALHDLRTGDVIVQRRLQATVDDFLGVSDQVAAESVHALLEYLGEVPSVELGRLTDSPQALLAFVRGETAFNRYRLVEARDAFLEAVEHDSTFALAHYRLTEINSWGVTAGTVDVREHQRLMAANVDRLSPRLQILVDARAAETRAEGIARLQRGVEAYPDDATMWYRLGEARIHSSVGFPTLDDVERPFLEAVRLEPNRLMFYSHAIATAMRERNDTALARRLVTRFAELGEPQGPFAVDYDPRVGPFALALAYGSPEERTAAHQAMDTLSHEFLIATMVYFEAPQFSEQLETLGLAAWERIPDVDHRGLRPDKPLLRASMSRVYASYQGRVARAFDFLDVTALGLNGLTTANNGLLFYLYAMGLPVPPDRMERAFGRVRGDSTESSVDLFAAAVYALDQQRPEDFGRLVDSLKARGLVRWPNELLGYRAWRAGNADGAIALLASDTSATRVGVWWLGNAYLDAGRWGEAQQVFNTSSWAAMFDSFRLEPLAQQRLGQAYEAQGKLDEAVEAYGYFLEHWADADPELQPLVEETRERVQAILDRQG
jgi:serine/threonine protein kinase/tetratricopeptide (TPR) repeat protein